MSLITLLVVLFFTGALKDMPKAVLAGIVFLIGVDLIDVTGLRHIYRRRSVEFGIAVATAVVVFAVGVEQGIILAIVLSILEIIRRQYNPAHFVVGTNAEGAATYEPAVAGTQSAPGLIVFRYDADLFYANANRFVDDVESIISGAPDPVQCLILDAGALSDIDYSAGLSLSSLLDYLRAHGIVFKVARADSQLTKTLANYDLLDAIGEDNLYETLVEAIASFRANPSPTVTRGEAGLTDGSSVRSGTLSSGRPPRP